MRPTDVHPHFTRNYRTNPQHTLVLSLRLHVSGFELAKLARGQDGGTFSRSNNGLRIFGIVSQRGRSGSPASGPKRRDFSPVRHIPSQGLRFLWVPSNAFLISSLEKSTLAFLLALRRLDGKESQSTNNHGVRVSDCV
ncbi:hypothetical protein CEXT_41621 [Caerostris extrusa]|uniref:Uncharacterized protein n=1 Tax=Caerostris extrusa TaxID=172846 RepID=A0AAV4PX59_CAEEX|nr:hypothetical protein CEXT_41621 [Caerostris extrusa]